MSLPHNNEVTKPRALNTFLDGLGELSLLSDLIEKEKGYRNEENTENNNEESSSDIENRYEVASENGSETEETQESDNDTENDSEETGSNTMKRPPPFTLKIPVNIVRILKCTGH